jgi:hypothetical protein
MSLENLLPLGKMDLRRAGLASANQLELIDKCVGSQIWVIMNGGKGMMLSNGLKSMV